MKLFAKDIDITEDDIFADIKNILRNTLPGEEVILVSPYLKFNDKVRDTLSETLSRGVRIVLLIRKDVDQNAEDIEFLANSSIEVYELSFLHAKVYWCKFVAVVTSMNLHDSSDRKNTEIAVFFSDKREILQIEELIKKWISKAKKISNIELANRYKSQQASSIKLSIEKNSKYTSQNKLNKVAFCIRCSKEIEFDLKKPLCETHFIEWDKYKNPKYMEKYCHKCGQKTQTNFANPICQSCK